MPKKSSLDIKPLTPARWKDLETLFGGPGGAHGARLLEAYPADKPARPVMRKALP